MAILSQVIAFVVALQFCSGKEYGLSINGGNDYAYDLATGYLKAMADANVNLDDVNIYNWNFDRSSEKNGLDYILSNALVNGMSILPIDMDNTNAAVLKGTANGVSSALADYAPLSYAAGNSQTDLYKGLVFIDNEEGGKMIGEYIKSNTDAAAASVQVCLVQGLENQGFSLEITTGLKDAIQDTNIQIAYTAYGNYSGTEAASIVEKCFADFPNLKVIVAYSASMSDGIAKYLKDNQRTGILHISSDCDDELVTWIKEGTYVQATRYYSSASTGRISGTMVYKAVNNMPFEKIQNVSQTMATSANIDSVVAETPYVYAQYRNMTRSKAQTFVIPSNNTDNDHKITGQAIIGIVFAFFFIIILVMGLYKSSSTEHKHEAVETNI